ncbi:hypothetical protein [Candidatus Absconditicoccus praedator]|uniref:hypothetical protein n=1 Tax=Candidatus Absconditicoccus praedator TaxID=2735562 RepID=UPI001E3EEC22|nr:hypothetical protein [Candidatus Absconditicoccus praedator]UFX82863.1 hypothetical protein HLG78_01885 [Candidatus Absconditicoccus praedator]
MIGRIILGLFVCIAGGLLVYYSAQLVRVFGSMQWAEAYLGGTRQAYVLIGFFLMVFGLLMMFGVTEFGGGVDDSFGVPSDNMVE